MRELKIIIVLCGLTLLGCDSNSKPMYGDTGLPKNCRALIQANIDGWKSGKYSCDDAMDSMERNCGTYGYIWGE